MSTDTSTAKALTLDMIAEAVNSLPEYAEPGPLPLTQNEYNWLKQRGVDMTPYIEIQPLTPVKAHSVRKSVMRSSGRQHQ